MHVRSIIRQKMNFSEINHILDVTSLGLNEVKVIRILERPL